MYIFIYDIYISFHMYIYISIYMHGIILLHWLLWFLNAFGNLLKAKRGSNWSNIQLLLPVCDAVTSCLTLLFSTQPKTKKHKRRTNNYKYYTTCKGIVSFPSPVLKTWKSPEVLTLVWSSVELLGIGPFFMVRNLARWIWVCMVPWL